MRKIILFSGILILIAAIVFLGIKYFPAKQEKPLIQTFSTKQNPAFKAVPQKSPLIIEVKDQEGFFKTLKGDNPLFAEFRHIPEFENIFSNISHLRDFVSSRAGIANLLKSKSIIITVNPSGKNQLANLFLVQMNDQNESNTVVEVISRELGSEYITTRKNYDNATILNAKSTSLNFYYACVNDIFMISEDFILVEEAIRQSKSDNLLSNIEFTEVYKTIEETALANVFINHQTISQILSKVVAPEIRKMLTQMTSYSDWSELDLSANSTQFELNGYSVTRDSSDNYLNIFHNQESEKLTIDKAIPVSSSYFVALNLKNTSLYIDRYESYLRTKGNYYPREMNLIEFRKKTNTDAVKLIKELVGNQVAGVYTNINKSNPSQNRFFVAEVMNSSDAKEKLKKAVSEYTRIGRPGEEKILTEYVLGDKKTFNIYRLPFANMAESLFGKAFSGINANYFALYEKYLICGDNLPGMKNYLQSLAAGKTMANDSIYQANIKESQPKPNFYMYSRIPKVFRLKDVLFKAEVGAMLSKNEDVIRKFSTFSWQFSVSGSMIKNRLALKYDPNFKEEPQSVWQLKLEGKLAQKPVFMLNQKDLTNREVIVCDNQNNVSLINKEGLVLWTMNIPGEIISDIQQVDLYQNNRLQYVFNTKTQIYVIDRMGNKFGKFPVTLKSKASNGLMLVDYGKNKEFRFFIAGEDQKIYAFDRWGNLVKSWNFAGSETLITKPGMRIEVGDKDYLIFSDQQNTYFLDRQGKSRDIEAAPFNHSGNQMYFFNNGNPRLITTDQQGRIHILDFAGQAEIKEFGKFGTAHHFVAADLDGNGSPEYIFADDKKLTILSSDGKKIGEHSFPDLISETPIVSPMGAGNIKIGVVIKGENKVYLLDKNGTIMRGLPLEGDTNFILGKFNDSNAWFNLIVGEQNNSLINYRIE